MPGFVRLGFRIQEKALVPLALLIQVHDPGDSLRRRNEQVGWVVEPQKPQYRLKFPKVIVGIELFHHLENSLPDSRRDVYLACKVDLLRCLTGKLESHDFQVSPDSGHRTIGVAHFRIGDVPFTQVFKGVINGAWHVRSGHNEFFILIGEGDFLLPGDVVETGRQVQDGLGFLPHGNEEIGVHVGKEPVQILRGFAVLKGQFLVGFFAKHRVHRFPRGIRGLRLDWGREGACFHRFFSPSLMRAVWDQHAGSSS